MPDSENPPGDWRNRSLLTPAQKPAGARGGSSLLAAPPSAAAAMRGEEAGEGGMRALIRRVRRSLASSPHAQAPQESPGGAPAPEASAKPGPVRAGACPCCGAPLAAADAATAPGDAAAPAEEGEPDERIDSLRQSLRALKEEIDALAERRRARRG